MTAQTAPIVTARRTGVGPLDMARCSLKTPAEGKRNFVTVPFNTWFSHPFGPGSEYEDPRGWHSETAHPERITPDVDGECIVSAKFNYRDILKAGATQWQSRFARMHKGDPELDYTWTDKLGAGGMTDGLFCKTAPGPQKSVRVGEWWVAQHFIVGPPGGCVVCETAEFIMTVWFRS